MDLLLLARVAWPAAYLLASASWVYAVQRMHPPGWRRGALCAPFAAAHLAAIPWLTDWQQQPMYVLPIAGTFSFAAFKVVGLVLGRGALVPPSVSTHYPSFVAAAVMPVIPEAAFVSSKASSFTSAGSRRNSIADQVASLGGRLLVGVVAAAAAHAPGLPPRSLAACWLYILTLNMFLGAVTDLFALSTTTSLGLRLAPCFDRPYFSASMAEFWSQRWNVTTTYLLRMMVYDPIVEGRLLARPPGKPAQQEQPQRMRPSSMARRLLGLQATFVVSALWHVLLFWLLTGTIGWEWPAFFVIQGPLLVAEMAARRLLAAWRGGKQPAPRVLCVIATNLLLIAIARPLLIEPLLDAGVVDSMFAQALAQARPLLQLTGLVSTR